MNAVLPRVAKLKKLFYGRTMFAIKNISFSNILKQFNCSQAYLCFNTIRNYTPRRAILYVPGDSLRKLKKAWTLNVDCIAMDCEDGVAFNKKTTARETINSLLNEGRPAGTKFDWAVRINPIDTNLCHDDLSSITTAKNLPDTILLPKVNNIEQLKWFSDQLEQMIPKEKRINLIMLIESAVAVMNLSQLCEFAAKMSTKIVSIGLIFGSDDFCANIGAIRTDDSNEILYARQKMVLIAKAYNLQAIDMVYINYKDLTGLQKQCEQGMRMGYTGKQIIHPDQIPVVQQSFLPNEKQIEWATNLIKAFKEHEQKGVGAFNYEGNMIDMPTIRQAENVIEIIKRHHS